MVLKATKEKCFDFKYDKFLRDMRSTDWNSSASEGGSIPQPLTVVNLRSPIIVFLP